jgi:hypothetical protein
VLYDRRVAVTGKATPDGRERVKPVADLHLYTKLVKSSGEFVGGTVMAGADTGSHDQDAAWALRSRVGTAGEHSPAPDSPRQECG